MDFEPWTLESAASEAREWAAKLGRTMMIIRWNDGGYAYKAYSAYSQQTIERIWNGDVPGCRPSDLRIVASVHPSGACHFVETL